jgi:signal transduction histidine kinase
MKAVATGGPGEAPLNDMLAQTHTPLASTSSRAAPDTVDARMIALMRCVLALSGMAIIYIAPTEPARFVELTYFSLILYCLWSIVLYVGAERGLFSSTLRYSPWIDVLWASYLVALTQGTSSIFFFLFLYSVLVASFSRGYREGMMITAVSTILFISIGLLSAPKGDEFELNRTLIRPIYLFVFGWMISYWGGREIALKRRLLILQEIGSQWNPRLGVDRTIGVNLERLVDFFGATECILALRRPTNPPTFFTYQASNRRQPRSGPPDEITENAASMLLALPETLAAVYESPRRGIAESEVLSSSRRHGSHEQQFARLANLFDTNRFATAPYRQRDGTYGRLYIVPGDAPAAVKIDVDFLVQLVSAIAQSVENTQLTDELVLKAAEHERFRISLDIHDTTVQPYVGLKLGLDALHREAGENNPLSRRIGELLEMATMTIRDLRGYATALREKAPMSGKALISAVTDQAERFNRFYGVEVEVQSDPELRVGAQVAAEAFRIVSEGLSNVLRHTTARRAFVRLLSRDGWLQIAIGNEASHGSGSPRSFTPRSISERAMSLGGTSFVENSEDGHTVVHVSIPT